MHSGEKLEVNDKCSKHVLNAFGQRGLTFLFYGCNEEKVKEDAIATNVEFKKRQVANFNIDNEQRSMKKLGYLPPSQVIKKYALELGIKLIEPYTLKDEEKAAISDSTRENAELKIKLAEQAKEMAELREMMKQFLKQKQPEDKPETESTKSELRVKRDGKWVKEER